MGFFGGPSCDVFPYGFRLSSTRLRFPADFPHSPCALWRSPFLLKVHFTVFAAFFLQLFGGPP